MIPLTLNWFGVAVHDVPAATHFYGKTLGMSFRQEKPGDALWRYFETRRMTFELFQAHPARIQVNGWGHGQPFRPVILVDDLAAEVEALRRQGISVSGADAAPRPRQLGRGAASAGNLGFRCGLRCQVTHRDDWARGNPLGAGAGSPERE